VAGLCALHQTEDSCNEGIGSEGYIWLEECLSPGTRVKSGEVVLAVDLQAESPCHTRLAGRRGGTDVVPPATHTRHWQSSLPPKHLHTCRKRCELIDTTVCCALLVARTGPLSILLFRWRGRQDLAFLDPDPEFVVHSHSLSYSVSSQHVGQANE